MPLPHSMQADRGKLSGERERERLASTPIARTNDDLQPRQLCRLNFPPILFHPFADVVPSEQIIDIGRKARLECLTEERDRGAISWRKDGRALPAHVARLVATRNVLQIFNLQREDYGMYQCFVDRHRQGGGGKREGGGAGNVEAQAGSELRLGGEMRFLSLFKL